MMLDSVDFAAIWLTFKLASLTTALLLLIGTPLAWWLARTHSPLKAGRRSGGTATGVAADRAGLLSAHRHGP